jgi:hypothetical protein
MTPLVRTLLLVVLPLVPPVAASRAPAPKGTCTTEQRRAALRRIQADVLKSVPTEVASLDKAVEDGGPLAGWQLPHGHVVLAGAGGVAVQDLDARPPLPPVLIYAPSPSSAPESWLDFEEEDGPYRLDGWAFVAPYQEGSKPPAQPCVAEDEWYVHQAGWHLGNGAMLLTPDAATEPPRPDPETEVSFWHPRLWEAHFWSGEDGVPTVSLYNPDARRGGVDLPAGAFFHFVDGRRQDAPSPHEPSPQPR